MQAEVLGGERPRHGRAAVAVRAAEVRRPRLGQEVDVKVTGLRRCAAVADAILVEAASEQDRQRAEAASEGVTASCGARCALCTVRACSRAADVPSALSTHPVG